MKETKERNTNKGITLIALVITIIVMLILLSVTISMAVNGGLFNYAGKATGETKNAINAEQQLANGGIEVDGVWYDSIDDYLARKPATTAIHSWTRSGDTFRCSHCEAQYTMGEKVNYQRENAGETITTILTAEKSGLDKYYAENSEYPPEANVDANGNQTIEAQDTTWVVLGIEDTDKDGVNETLLITTETDLWTRDEEENWWGICFYGAAAYNNVPDEINRICKELYSNSEYGEARGMTIEDVNTALNYTPHGGEYYDPADSTGKTTGNLTTKLKDLPTWDNIKGKYITPDGTNTVEAYGEYELNGYYYFLIGDGTALANEVNSTTSAITAVENDTIFGPYNEDWEGYPYYYWLASRSVCAGADYALFGPGGVEGGEARSAFGLLRSNGRMTYLDSGLRPVVPLTSELPALFPPR